MQVIFYNNSSGNEHVHKKLTEVATFEVELKDSCSIQNPVLLLSGKYLSANYCRIGDFGGRYYYIDDITQIRKNLWQYDLRCDVLMSFSKEIESNKAIIERTESPKYYNKNFDDSEWNRMVEARCTNQILNFPEKFVKNFSDGKYVLVTVGVGGTVVNP